MDKKLILAVAGAGKTYHICHNIDDSKRNLILAFTNRNINNIERELIDAKVETKNVKVFTFHKFIYNFFLRPFEVSIGEFYSIELKSKGLIFDESEKPIKEDGKFNWKYKGKDFISHFLKNDRYFSSNISELVLFLNEKTDIFNRAINNINYFFDNIYIDEFQDFRENNYKLLELIIKNCNNITLVGDYFQHSVSGPIKFGLPFQRKKKNKTTGKFDKYYIPYELFKQNIEKIGIIIDDTTLSKSRRCSKNICEFVRNKLQINIYSLEKNVGNVIFVEKEDELKKVLDNDNIKKLVYNTPYKYTFNADSWSYCKGDTYNNICVILTNRFKRINDIDFNIDGIPQQTINMLYVAFTRTRGNLYVVSDTLFKKIEKDYLYQY